MTTSPSGPGIQWASVELGPELPLAVFTSSERWNPERIGTLAFYCSDGRWGEAFDEFCHKHLLVPRYDRWAVPGGPAWLVAGNVGPPFLDAVRQQLDLLVRVHALQRIVLITHYGCAYYGQRLQRSPEECLPAQAQDVRTAAAGLRGWFPGLRVEGYLAMRSGNCLSFHRLQD